MLATNSNIFTKSYNKNKPLCSPDFDIICASFFNKGYFAEREEGNTWPDFALQKTSNWQTDYID